MTMKTTKTTHKQEIEVTRVGGFGGSDANMFYRVGLRGLSALNNTDKKRIRVAKGMDEYKPIFVNDAMQRGHDFEDWYERQPFAPLNAEREAKITGDMAMNFKIFAHADFYDKEVREVWELKCLSNPENAYKDYFSQLQWYHMLGVTKVRLVVCDSSKKFEDGVLFPIEIERDDNLIDILRDGIRLLDENWETLDLNVGEEWSDSDLMPFEQREVEQMTLYLQEIKILEAKADEMKANLFEMMKANNITSLNSKRYVINMIGDSTTTSLDKKKLFTEHPEISEQDYLKISPRKAHLKITLKN